MFCTSIPSLSNSFLLVSQMSRPTTRSANSSPLFGQWRVVTHHAPNSVSLMNLVVGHRWLLLLLGRQQSKQISFSTSKPQETTANTPMYIPTKSWEHEIHGSQSSKNCRNGTHSCLATVLFVQGEWGGGGYMCPCPRLRGWCPRSFVEDRIAEHLTERHAGMPREHTQIYANPVQMACAFGNTGLWAQMQGAMATSAQCGIQLCGTLSLATHPHKSVVVKADSVPQIADKFTAIKAWASKSPMHEFVRAVPRPSGTGGSAQNQQSCRGAAIFFCTKNS